MEKMEKRGAHVGVGEEEWGRLGGARHRVPVLTLRTREHLRGARGQCTSPSAQ